MSGAPLPRLRGLGSFDGVDEFEDSRRPRTDADADAGTGGPTPSHARRGGRAGPTTCPSPTRSSRASTTPSAGPWSTAARPLLVVAGAGSGKTRVLTHRVAHLIATGDATPWEILAITFTNKAADEMRERLVGLIGPVAQRMWVSTFHAACVRMLRAHADRLGYRKSFTIYDDTDSRRLVEHILRDLNIDAKKLPARGVQAAISGAKAELAGADDLRAGGALGLRAAHRRRLPGVRAAAVRRLGHGLRRPAAAHRPAVPGRARRPRRLPHPVQAHPRRRVPGHQPRPERDRAHARRRSTTTCAWWATATSRSSGGAAPTSATSWSSKRRSPTPR